MDLRILVALFSFSITRVSGLVCLSCTNIAQPRHCHAVKECQHDQFCATERFTNSFGEVNYNIGCLDKQKCHANQTTGVTDAASIQCLECCHGDLCNVNLCGAIDYPNQTAPICYSCKSLPRNRKCHQIDVCENGEECFVQATEEFGEDLINSGCKTSLICDALSGSNTGPGIIVGKRSSHARSSTHIKCSRCCNQHLCNDICDVTGPHDCLDIKIKQPTSTSGPYSVNLKSGRRIDVWCDMSTGGGGWTVFQKRYDGSVDFNQTFTSYQHGFGNITGEFWLGLDNIHELTTGQTNSLRVDFTYKNGTDFYEQLPRFNVGPGIGYALHVSDRSTSTGTIRKMYYLGDKSIDTTVKNPVPRIISYVSLKSAKTNFLHLIEVPNGGLFVDNLTASGIHILRHRPCGMVTLGSYLDFYNGQNFSTYDMDQDSIGSLNCGQMFHGGFWYNDCIHFVNPNGLYEPGGSRYDMAYIDRYGNTAIQMKFRRNV